MLLILMLSIFTIGSIFINTPMDSTDYVEEHKKQYKQKDIMRNENELTLFKKYAESLPDGYKRELKKIKVDFNVWYENYEREKKIKIENQNFFGFKNRKTFWTYIGMLLTIIGLCFSANIGLYVKDDRAKIILSWLYFLTTTSAVLYIHWALSVNSDLPAWQHATIAFIYFLGSFIIIKSTHQYLKNFPFYMTSISQLNKWILLKALNFISNDKKQKYIEESIKHIEKTLYTEKGNKFN